MLTPRLPAVVVLVTTLGLFAPSARAMPMFARKYHLPCAGCHDAPTFPRLNEVGYKFRRAGFRMPEQIGQDEASDYNPGDYMSARIQARYTVSHTSDDRTGTSTSSNSNVFEMREITLYPITGSFMKYFATETEISMAPDEIVELENGYVRAVIGDQNTWYEARIGLFHPFEGFGASDRPVSQSRPLFETVGANHNQDTLFRIWGIDRVGAEVGVQFQQLSVSLAVLGRLNTEVEGGSVVGVGVTPSNENGKDLLAFANYILDAHSGVSAYWAHGATTLPVAPAGFIDETNTATFHDTYDRFALFASKGIGSITALAGGELGRDDRLDDPVTLTTSRFTSWGAFAELDAALGPNLAGFLRYDYFDPSTDQDNNHRHGVTAGATLYHDWVYVTPELQLRTQAGGSGSRVDTLGFLHFVAIY